MNAAALPSFDPFTAEARAAGFDELTERQWAPDTVLATHSHPFSVGALVIQGEMWLRCGGTGLGLATIAMTADAFGEDRAACLPTAPAVPQGQRPHWRRPSRRCWTAGAAAVRPLPGPAPHRAAA